MDHPAFAIALAVLLRGPVWTGAPAGAGGYPGANQTTKPPSAASAVAAPAAAASLGWNLRVFRRLSFFDGGQLVSALVDSSRGAWAVRCALDAPETISELKKDLRQLHSRFAEAVFKLNNAADPKVRHLLEKVVSQCEADIADVEQRISRLSALEQHDKDTNVC
eukprot:contig_20503_g5040